MDGDDFSAVHRSCRKKMFYMITGYEKSISEMVFKKFFDLELKIDSIYQKMIQKNYITAILLISPRISLYGERVTKST